MAENKIINKELIYTIGTILANYLLGTFLLLDYHFWHIIELNIFEISFLVGTIGFSLIGITFSLSDKKDPTLVFFTIGLGWLFFSATYILVDMTNGHARLGLDKNSSYWFFSTIVQGFAALLAIIGGFLVIGIKKNNAPKSAILSPFYPAITFIAIGLIVSLILLPFSPVLEVYSQFLFSSIVFIIFIGIIGVFWLCYSLHNIF